MANTQSVNEEIFDILLRKALIDRYTAEAEQTVSNYDKHIYSKKFLNRIKKTGRSVNRAKILKAAGRILFKTAITLTSLMGIMFGTLMSQPEVYAAVENVMRTVFSDHDKYEFNNNQTDSSVFVNSKHLDYIPEDYTLLNVFYAANVDQLSYTYKSVNDEKYIYFDYGFAGNLQISVDNESHTLEIMNINNITYYYYKCNNIDDDSNILLWYDDKYCYVIDAQLDRDIIVNIAENIK